MGTVQALRDHEHAALGAAVTAFLVTLDHPESRGTLRVYASTLRALRAEFGDATDTGTLEPRSCPAPDDMPLPIPPYIQAAKAPHTGSVQMTLEDEEEAAADG